MDLGMSELLVIGIVALIVIGPKDLPEMFRQLGRFTAKMRAMSREFSRAMEQAANETGVSGIAKDLKTVADPKSVGLNAVKDAVDKFEKWDPIKNAAKPTVPQTASTLVPPPMPPVVKPAAAVDAVVEAAKADAPAPVVTYGPNTAALYEKKAARDAILQETAAKLKALDAAPLSASELAAATDAPATQPSTKAAEE